MAASPAVIDVERLLSPIDAEKPVGKNLLHSDLHSQIMEARSADDGLARGDWERKLKAADWSRVINLAVDAISTKTKDLQICAVLAEAQVKKNGFSGLRDGLKLTRGLQERFWEQIYPVMEDGDLEARANALDFLDRQCAQALKEVAIAKASGVSCSYLDWERVNQPNPPESTDSLGVNLDGFNKTRNATRRAFYEETFAVLNECWEEFVALDGVMDQKFGPDRAPGMSELKKVLSQIRAWVERTLKEKRMEEPDARDPVAQADEPAAEGVTTPGEPAAVGVTGGPIRTREDALRRLREVAEYFRRTEPHSPVSYLVQRAISWGHMPLDAWLGDVIKDGSLLDALRETLGLKTTMSSRENS